MPDFTDTISPQCLNCINRMVCSIVEKGPCPSFLDKLDYDIHAKSGEQQDIFGDNDA